MENTIQLELLALVKACRQFESSYLPSPCNMHINLGEGYANVWIFNCINHAQGLEVKRLLGIEDAEKAVYNPDTPYHTLKAKLDGGVEVCIECSGLPPSCKVETYEEEIPKSEVVTLSETIKVKRTRICCGQEEK